MFSAAKYRAKLKNLRFTMTLERIENALKIGLCETTKIPFRMDKMAGRMRNPFSPSVDRIIPSHGYTDKNVQIVCVMYNTGKGEHRTHEFNKLCVAIASNAAKTLNLNDTAKYLGFKKRTMHNMLNSGRFPVEPLPGITPRRWSVEALDAWLKQTAE